MKRLIFLFLVASLVAITSASASVVPSIPGGTPVAMPGINYSGGGPQTFGPSITWTSTNVGNGTDSVFGWTMPYDFGLNGHWDGSLGPMAGLNDSFDIFGLIDTMTFSFATPVSAVGGFLNFYLALGGNSTPATIAVWDAHGNLIESYDLVCTTCGGVNSGVFVGFQETSNIISSFTLTDNYIGITDLTYAYATPEPASLVLLASGLIGALGYVRKRIV